MSGPDSKEYRENLLWVIGVNDQLQAGAAATLQTMLDIDQAEFRRVAMSFASDLNASEVRELPDWFLELTWNLARCQFAKSMETVAERMND